MMIYKNIHAGTYRVEESRSINIRDMPIEEVGPYLMKEAEGLTDPRLSIEADECYGGYRVFQHVEGERPATAQEIAAYEKDLKRKEASRRTKEEKDLEDLRKRRPDLFKS